MPNAAVRAAAPGLPNSVPLQSAVRSLYAKWLTLRGREADEDSLCPNDPDGDVTARTAAVEEAAEKLARTPADHLLDVHHKVEVLNWLIEREEEMGPTVDQRHLAMLRSISRDVMALACS